MFFELVFEFPKCWFLPLRFPPLSLPSPNVGGGFARVRPECPSIRLCEGKRFRKRALSESERSESERLLPAPNSSAYARHLRVITISFLLQVRLVRLRVAAASTSFDSSAYAQSGLLLSQDARLGLLPSAQSPVAARARLMRASVTVRMMASS